MTINYSFIIPHHNSPELLIRCLDSIPQREDIEIIVVDDNSDADKRPHVERSDVELLYIDAEHTKGAGRARNYGLKKAQGKWLLFADCDDYYEKGFLQMLDEFKDSTYDIIYFDAFHGIDIQTGRCSASPVEKTLERFLIAPDKKENVKILKHSSNDPWNKMFRRSFIEQIDAKFDEVPATNDAWFCHYAATKTNNIYGISKKLYYWVKNPNSITTAKRTWAFEKQRAETGARVHHLVESDGACECLPYPWKGFKAIYERNGLLFAICLFVYKCWIDVNPLKVLYYKFRFKRRHRFI